MNQEKIGKFICKCRKEKNLTQEQLAEKLNITSKSISRWENGKTMPDLSLMKPLCEKLDITINELLSGEKISKNNIEKKTENILINTIKYSQQTKQTNNKLKIIIVGIIILITLFTITSLIFYKLKYPKIDIYNIEIIKSNKEELNKKQTIKYNNFNIYFYGINSLQLGDMNEKYYDLNNALSYKQTTISDIKKYLKSQYNNGNIKRYVLYDGGTQIYKSNKYTIILCNTLDKNKDIYFGVENIESKLKGAYCGHKANNTCTFTRTYKIINISEHDEEEFINVTLSEFQGQTALVKINKDVNIKVGYNYEFTFQTYEHFDDNINNIFENSILIETNQTSKTGLEQINQKICINN